MADARPLVVREALFTYIVGLETQKALRLQYHFSVVTVVRDATTAAGSAPADAILAAVSRVTRAADVVSVVPGQAAVRVLLIGCDRDGADKVIARIHDELGGEPSLRFGWAGFPATTTVPEEVVGRADATAGLVAR